MSIDFDSAALQTQQDEEEYDPEDYAREQELHKLLTDLPHDMLDDSRESSSPELECSTCSNKISGNSPKSSWPQPWSDHPKPTSHPQNYEPDFNQGSHDQYTYEDEAVQTEGHRTQPHSQPLPHTWNQDHQFSQGDYTCTSVCTEKSAVDFSTEFESEQYTQTTNNHVEYNGDGGCRDQQIHYQCGAGDNGQNKYKPSYNPHHTTLQPKMFNPQRAQQDAQFDHLQREFLDSTQQNAERQQLAQLQILNKAQQRQIEDLEQKLEDSRRNMRYLEHQFTIVKDERDGFAVSLKESSQLVEEAKVRDVQMQNKLNAMEQQVQILNERDQENLKKQRVADAAVDTIKQQMLELCRSDTLSRAREQHDRDLTVMKEQHESALLVLQQKLDATSQALDEQVDAGQNVREQLKHLERQREEEQLERARVVNGLTHRLEESQQQCAKLLETNSVQEMSQMQIKLQQAQSAKALSENMNKVLQEDMADLQEQITLYESAVKHGVVSFDLHHDWENHLSESCLDLGLKKTNRKNGTVLSTAVAHLSDSKLPKDEALRLLRVEMQRCLGSLKGKRQKISQLQEELQLCRAQVNKLQNELEEVKVNASAKEVSQRNPINVAGDAQKELLRLQEDKQNLQKKLELLDKNNKELKQTEEKLKSANSELCTKMREMIQELDQEKQEATERSERIHQQYRDDVVNQIRADLVQEHDAQIQQLNVQHQQQAQQLQTQLSEVNDKMLAVQECYISICKEKDMLEESIRKREQEETTIKDESDAAVEKLRAELEARHQASVLQLKVLWSKEKEAEVQQKVDSHIAAAKAAWKEELQKTEKTWVQRVEDARREKCKETSEMTCQTDMTEANSLTVTAEELDSRLSAQKQQLRVEADRERSKAVEETIKRVQRDAQEKHLEDMAKQVEGAVTRAYNRWIDELASLPEYQASLQTERRKWEELQEKHIEQRVCEALRGAGEQWHRKHSDQLEEQRSAAQKVQELQEEVTALQGRLDQVSREHAALMKAELAGVKAAWNRDKQREIAMIKTQSEQTYQTKLQEQSEKLEQTVQEAREDAEVQKKELLLQMEAKLQQTLRTREEEWRCQHADKQAARREQMRADLMAELQTGLMELQAKLLRDHENDSQDTEDMRKTSGASLITQVIQTSCTDLVNKVVSQAKKRWEKMSDERLNRKLKETQERHEREFHQLQGSLSQCKEASACKKECVQTTCKLQKKNQELQGHLAKTCRQLQHSVREHKAAVQNLKDEHHSSLQRTKEEHLQQLAAVKRDGESSIHSNQQKLQQGIEEMKQQYLTTVEKIREDMLRYLQESRERAAEMIRKEVQRERQDTARKMRHYYLTCLQELLEDGGKTKGAEKKIMNAASKLAAMAKVLETPIKYKSEKIRPPGLRSEERSHRDKTRADSEQRLPAAVRTELLGHRDSPASREEEEKLVDSGTKTKSLPAHKSSHQVAFQSLAESANVSLRSKSREPHPQGSDSTRADNGVTSEPWNRPFFIQEVPVREKKCPDWSMTSTDSDTSFNMPRLSFLGRQVEPVKPFAVSAAPGGVLEADGHTPDDSDVTVYNEITQKTPPSETLRRSTDREPTPGSECERPQGGCLRTLYSELRRHQQDSGFDSPFYQQK